MKDGKKYGAVKTQTGSIYLKQCDNKRLRNRAMLFSRSPKVDHGFVPCMLTVEQAKELRKVLRDFIKDQE